MGHLAGLMPGLDDNDAPRLISALEGVLAEYSAQNLHFNYRQSLDGNKFSNYSASGCDPLTSNGQPATVTVTDRTRLRLVQDEVPTRVLQGLLGAMALCLVAESILVCGGRVIPRDPGSIASKMAYFAGGQLWRDLPIWGGQMDR